VREAYTDADGLLEHGFHVAEARDKLFGEYADGHHMTLYSEPSPRLAELMNQLAGHVKFTRLTFLQGLDSPIREEVLQ
jgi:hypothetical protein